MKKPFYILIFCLLAISGNSIAVQENLSPHTIQLNYRQAEDIISLLRPFLHPDGVMTGEGYKILLKTTDKNYRDLLQLVAEIDVSMRQLRISVTLDDELVESQSLNKTAPETPSDDTGTTRQLSTQRRDQSPRTQQIQVLEGKWANISTGESVPVGQRVQNPDGTITESVTYKSVSQRFQVLPRISGDRVTLFVRQQQNGSAPLEDNGQTRSAETSLSGKLDQWILIGGVTEITVDQPGSRVYSTAKRTESNQQMFVKVEVIK